MNGEKFLTRPSGEELCLQNSMKPQNEKTKQLFQTNLNHLNPSWNPTTLSPWSKRSYADRYHLQRGLGCLRDYAVDYCVSHQTRAKDRGKPQKWGYELLNPGEEK